VNCSKETFVTCRWVGWWWWQWQQGKWGAGRQ